MTAPGDGQVHYDVTRESLMAAAGNLPLTAWLNKEACGKFADALLAQMPAVPAGAMARLAELENAINWGTSCTSCAAVLDSSIRDHERAERAEEKLAAVVRELEPDGRIGRTLLTGALPTNANVARNELLALARVSAEADQP